MTSQSQRKFNFRSRVVDSFNQIISSLLKAGFIILFTNVAFFTDAEASQRGRVTEDTLFERAHEGLLVPQREFGHYSSANTAESRRNYKGYTSRYLDERQLNTLLADTRISPPLPALSLMQTPRGVLEQHSAIVPIVKSSPLSFQLTTKNGFYKSTVGDQLQLGTCASFAVVDCLLFIHGETLSPAYLNVRAKHQYASDCANNGLNIGVAMKCALECGTVMDWVWPYKGYYSAVEKANEKISNTPQPSWDVCIASPYTESQDRGLVKFAFGEIKSLFVNDKKDERALLIRDSLIINKTPVIVSVPVKWNREWSPNLSTTGQIRTLLDTADIDGWHAISICGFNEEKEEVTFKNSWGLGWGNQGFGTMSYAYLIHHAREAWTGIGKQLKA